MRRIVLVLGLVTLCFSCRTSRPAGAPPQALIHEEQCAQALVVDELERATTECKLCLEFAPEHGNCWNNLGLIAYRQSALDEAKQSYIKAVRYEPENAQAYSNLGVLALDQKDCGTAAERFERALQVNPHYLEARYNLGIARYRCGDLQKAREAFLAVLAVSADIADAHDFLGTIALDEGKTEEAIARFTKATELVPSQGRYFGNLAAAYERAGRSDEAAEAYRSCLEADASLQPCSHGLVRTAR